MDEENNKLQDRIQFVIKAREVQQRPDARNLEALVQEKNTIQDLSPKDRNKIVTMLKEIDTGLLPQTKILQRELQIRQ